MCAANLKNNTKYPTKKNKIIRFLWLNRCNTYYIFMRKSILIIGACGQIGTEN